MAEEKALERVSCWIDRIIIRQAKEIAAREDKSLSEVLERELRSSVARRHGKLFAPADTGNPVA